jgi:hypothetical protein
MRIKVPKQPTHGTTRSIRKFLWFPKCLQDEWRWLESANIIQRYVEGMHCAKWVDIKWGSDQ